MVKGTLFLLTLLISGCLFSQEDVRYQLVLKRGAKTKVLNSFNDMTILSKVNTDRVIIEASVFITPTLQIVGDSLVVTANQCSTEEERTIGETKITTVEYPMSQPGKVRFHVNELDKITVGRTAVKVSSGLLCTLSVLSAIAVAPAMYIGPQFN
jgi:type II secretory pathway component PulC